MKWVAAALLVLGAGIVGYFFRRGPLVTVTPRALAWTPVDADAVVNSGIELGALEFTSAEVPSMGPRFGVVLRGAQWLRVDDFSDFDDVVLFDGGVVAVGELQVEGPGPNLELLVSSDHEHFVQLTVPKPHYTASYEHLEVDGSTWVLTLSLDDALPVVDGWTWAVLAPSVTSQPWLWRMMGPGRVRLVSRNGGKTWALRD